jgi:Ca2+-binding RTX toxin-like protein
MAHLASSYASYETFLRGADAFWSVDLGAMNNSGVTGDALLSVNTEEDGTRYLNISISAAGLTPDVRHAQHVHGTFDDEGNPSDARMPVTADDADQDGFVEVLEGLAAYGDILLPLTDGDGVLPMTRSDGTMNFIQSYELGDDSNFFSPVSGNDYTAADLMPMENREIVIHGQNVGSGFGAGTGGEINGSQDGYVGLLPVAAGEIEGTNRAQALDILWGRSQNDVLRGDGGDDHLFGNKGSDRLFGDEGDDHLKGHGGGDDLNGGSGNDMLKGHRGDDMLEGGAGRDMLKGHSGDDVLTGGNGRDVLTGGAGWDEFVYADMREGRDRITDFEDGIDLISLNTLGMDFADLSISDAGRGARVEFGNTSILLEGVMADQLDQSDFIF